MKKLLLASFLALLVVGLSQRSATANFVIHKPCIEVPIPPFPLVIPNIKFTCIKAPCDQYRAPNPWYTYYPPGAYGPYPHVYYPNYGAPPARVLPAPPPPAAPAVRPAALESTATAGKSAKQAGKQYASAKDTIAEAIKGITPTQAPQAAPQPAPAAMMIPVAGSDNYSSGVPSYWYGR